MCVYVCVCARVSVCVCACVCARVHCVQCKHERQGEDGARDPETGKGVVEKCVRKGEGFHLPISGSFTRSFTQAVGMQETTHV